MLGGWALGSDTRWPCGPGLGHPAMWWRPATSPQCLASSCAPHPPFSKAPAPEPAVTRSSLRIVRTGWQGPCSVTATRDRSPVSGASGGGEGGRVSVCLLVGPAHWGSRPAVRPAGRTSDRESVPPPPAPGAAEILYRQRALQATGPRPASDRPPPSARCPDPVWPGSGPRVCPAPAARLPEALLAGRVGGPESRGAECVRV